MANKTRKNTKLKKKANKISVEHDNTPSKKLKINEQMNKKLQNTDEMLKNIKWKPGFDQDFN